MTPALVGERLRGRLGCIDGICTLEVRHRDGYFDGLFEVTHRVGAHEVTYRPLPTYRPGLHRWPPEEPPRTVTVGVPHELTQVVDLPLHMLDAAEVEDIIDAVARKLRSELLVAFGGYHDTAAGHA